MPAKREIVILLHEKDRFPATDGYFIWALCEAWRESGIEIEVVKGTQKSVAADLLIPHIDATVLPQAYVDFFENHPRVVNRRLHDISKRLISRNLLARSDNHDGQVIVKTNLNSGGTPDANLAGHKIIYSRKPKSFWSGWLNPGRTKRSSDWREINCMDSQDYQLFPSLAAVPETVFANPSLVVERFLPEYENGIYYLRVYQFFGDCGYCARVGSRHPIVKQKNIISREEVPVPDGIVAIRRELGMDYGKLDFVMREGRIILLDVNRTPGRIKPIERMKNQCLKTGSGHQRLFLIPPVAPGDKTKSDSIRQIRNREWSRKQIQGKAKRHRSIPEWSEMRNDPCALNKAGWCSQMAAGDDASGKCPAIERYLSKPLKSFAGCPAMPIKQES